MKILALEFSSERRSVAVAQAQSTGPPTVLGLAVESEAPHTRGLAMVEAALAQAGWEREAVEAVVVGLGPGSYTGIRAALALAQGWHLARQVSMFGLGSVECLASQAQSAGCSGLVHFIVDAQRDEFYLASYELSPTARQLVAPLRVVEAEEVRRRLQAGAPVFGPAAARAFPGAQDLFPDAAALARLAIESPEARAATFEPIYLRPASFVKAPPPRWLS